MRRTVVLGLAWIGLSASPALAGPPTYHKDVARILQTHCQDLTVQPLVGPVGGRSWCLMGHVNDASEEVLITTVIERWNGKVLPR